MLAQNLAFHIEKNESGWMDTDHLRYIHGMIGGWWFGLGTERVRKNNSTRQAQERESEVRVIYSTFLHVSHNAKVHSFRTLQGLLEYKNSVSIYI